jgi:hypothetical protein
MSDNKLNLETTNAIEYVEPEDGMLITYANNIQYGFTAGDMRLVFGELIDMQKGKATVEQRAQITFSWLTAKVIATILDALIKEHEKTIGPINVPPAMLEIDKL